MIQYSNTVWGSKIDMGFVSSAFIFILSFNAPSLLALSTLELRTGVM